MTEKRNFYLLRMSSVFANRRRAAEHAQAANMGLHVFRTDEGGWRAVELCPLPVYERMTPFEVSNQERSRLEAEITAAKIKTAKPAPEKAPGGYIDMTPSWQGLLPLLIEGLANRATPEGNRIAKEELIRMAQAADAWNAHCKGAK